MTARIYDQLHRFRSVTERHRPGGSDDPDSDPDERIHPGSRRRRTPDPNTSKVKRALFGPVNHEENLLFVRQELAKNRRQASERWNYDFENDRPIEGRYQWESVLTSPRISQSLVCDNSDRCLQSRTEKKLQESATNVKDREEDTERGEKTPESLIVTAHTSGEKESQIRRKSKEHGEDKSSSDSDSKTQNSSTTMRISSRKKEHKPTLSSQRQSVITDHFTQRKNYNKSKIKAQERRSESPVQQQEIVAVEGSSAKGSSPGKD